jgi:1,4-dihydroxy-2-naphthoate polyprenyltransferase
MESSETKYGEVNSIWDKARNIFRISYTLNFVFAALVGVAFAWTTVPEWTIGTLIVLDVFVLALFVNISNDYFDHKSGADSKRWEKYNLVTDKKLGEMFNEKLYWSGNAFDRGIVSDRTGKIIIAALAVIAVVLAVPILMFGGWVVLVMGGIAFFLSYFYTAPPLNLGARGLGEVDVFLSFTFLPLFSYLVLVNDINLEIMLISITVGLSVMLLRSVDQMSGYEAHKSAGEKDFSVRFGLEGAANVVIYCLAIIYAVDICLTLLFGIGYAVLLLTLPVTKGLIKIFRDKNDKYKWIRPVPIMLKIVMSQMLLTVIALTLMQFVSELAWHPF